MSLSDHNVAAPSSDPRRGSGDRGFCAECSERSHLAILVAELLYKNQILRFDLQDAQTQLVRVKNFSEDME
jgi:hypothetical protein